MAATGFSTAQRWGVRVFGIEPLYLTAELEGLAEIRL